MYGQRVTSPFYLYAQEWCDYIIADGICVCVCVKWRVVPPTQVFLVRDSASGQCQMELDLHLSLLPPTSH